MIDRQILGKMLHRALASFVRCSCWISDEDKWLTACLRSAERTVPYLLPTAAERQSDGYAVENDVNVGQFRGCVDLYYPSRNPPVIVDWKLAASAYVFERDLDARWKDAKSADDMLLDFNKYRASLAEQMLFYSIWLWQALGENAETGVEFYFVAIECPHNVADLESVSVSVSGWYLSPASLRSALVPVLDQRSVTHPTYYKQRPRSW